jgi:hypothetical protein
MPLRHFNGKHQTKLPKQSSDHHHPRPELLPHCDHSHHPSFSPSSNSFSQVEEETSETNQCTCIITFDSTNSSLIIECTVNIPDFDSSPHLSSAIISTLYLSASDQFHVPKNASMVFTPMQTTLSNSFPFYVTSIDSIYLMFVATKKKYKPVAQKVRPVIAELPDHFRIIQNIVGDPLDPKSPSSTIRPITSLFT